MRGPPGTGLCQVGNSWSWESPPSQHAPPPTGIQTSQDARFYAISSRFEPFSNRDKTLVVQFTVKHEQNIDCGGGYVKLFPASLNQEDMHGDSEYNIMFGGSLLRPHTPYDAVWDSPPPLTPFVPPQALTSAAPAPRRSTSSSTTKGRTS